MEVGWGKREIRILIISFVSLLILGGIFFYQYSKFSDRLFHIVFCDVGQGDAIFIKTPKGKNILVDGGPDDSVLSCLSNHMPFWDRELELTILTHPHLDHFNGLIPVLERYSVKYFATEKLENNTASFKELTQQIKKEKSLPHWQAGKVKYLYQGDSIKLEDGVNIKILAPSNQYLERTSPNGKITDSNEFSSLILLISFNSFDVLLTGDSQSQELEEVIAELDSRLPAGRHGSDGVEVLQVPHHGSKTGLNSNLLYQISPKLTLISVGKNNRYGHPSKLVLSLLKHFGAKTFRTDINGEIEITSNGKQWKFVSGQVR